MKAYLHSPRTRGTGVEIILTWHIYIFWDLVEYVVVSIRFTYVTISCVTA